MEYYQRRYVKKDDTKFSGTFSRKFRKGHISISQGIEKVLAVRNMASGDIGLRLVIENDELRCYDSFYCNEHKDEMSKIPSENIFHLSITPEGNLDFPSEVLSKFRKIKIVEISPSDDREYLNINFK